MDQYDKVIAEADFLVAFLLLIHNHTHNFLIYNQAQTINSYTDILFNVVHRTTRFALKQRLVVPFY